MKRRGAAQLGRRVLPLEVWKPPTCDSDLLMRLTTADEVLRLLRLPVLVAPARATAALVPPAAAAPFAGPWIVALISAAPASGWPPSVIRRAAAPSPAALLPAPPAPSSSSSTLPLSSSLSSSTCVQYIEEPLGSSGQHKGCGG